MWGRPQRPPTRPEIADPTRDHSYVEINDPGVGAVSSGSGKYGGNLMGTLGMTTAFLRSTRCAMPGCGKERHDPVHTNADV
jgi:hypothetical protein